MKAVANALLLAIAVALLGAGCKRNTAESKLPESSEGAAAGKDGMPAPSKAGLKRLCSDTNPYMSNNAKYALSCWDAQDYEGAASAMKKILNLCRSSDQQSDALSSLAQLKLEIDAAAAKGNAKAKTAAALLAQ